MSLAAQQQAVENAQEAIVSAQEAVTSDLADVKEAKGEVAEAKKQLKVYMDSSDYEENDVKDLRLKKVLDDSLVWLKDREGALKDSRDALTNREGALKDSRDALKDRALEKQFAESSLVGKLIFASGHYLNLTIRGYQQGP
jgi:hypothetical protein